jgi:hypothetical protein
MQNTAGRAKFSSLVPGLGGEAESCRIMNGGQDAASIAVQAACAPKVSIQW